MRISQKIKERLMPKGRGIGVEDVRIGLRYTSVLLEDHRAGVAFTFHETMTRGCSIFGGLYPLAGRDASDLLAFLDSENKVEMAVALATANALTNVLGSGLQAGDTMDVVPIGPKDTVGMVGYFAPVLPRLKKKTSSILIFEQVKETQADLLPEQEAYRQLPHCQVALITSTSILNHTVDQILGASRSCREVVLLGASTPLIPEVFTDTPVTFLSGIVVTDPPEILRIVSEGAGMRFFKGHVKKVNIPLRT